MSSSFWTSGSVMLEKSEIEELVKKIVSSFEAHYDYHFPTVSEIDTITSDICSGTDFAVVGGLPDCVVVVFHVERLISPRFVIVFPRLTEEGLKDITTTAYAIIERVKEVLKANHCV